MTWLSIFASDLSVYSRYALSGQTRAFGSMIAA